MPLVPLHKLRQPIIEFLTGQRQAIGFGAMQPAAFVNPIRLSYCVDPRQTIDFVNKFNDYWQQRPFEELKTADPERNLIVIYDQDFDAAVRLMEALGDSVSRIPMIPFFSYEYLRPYFSKLEQLPLTYKRLKRPENPQRAIVMRGAVSNDHHLRCIQKTARDHPHDLVIVATWKNTATPIMQELREIVDVVVECVQPANPGLQNRNLQLTTIQAGLQALAGTAVEKLLLMRTDMMFFQTPTLDLFEHLHALAFNSYAPVPQQRLKGRLVVPDFGIHKYFPYFYPDALMFGFRSDVETYWLGQQPDQRYFTALDQLAHNSLSLRDVAQQGLVNELYFGAGFMRALGVQPDYSVRQHYEVLRDYFYVQDLIQLEPFWVKKHFVNQYRYMPDHARTITHLEWTALQLRRLNVSQDAEQVLTMTWEAYKGIG